MTTFFSTRAAWEWQDTYPCNDWLANAGFPVDERVGAMAAAQDWQSLLAALQPSQKSLLWQVDLLGVCKIAPNQRPRTIPDPPKENTIATLNMLGSGLGDAELMIYPRAAVFKIWQHLREEKILFVTGPPGTGKSTAVWWWASSIAKPVIWVHFFKSLLPIVALLSHCAVEWYSMSTADVITAVDALMVRSSCTVLVLDGCTREHTAVMARYHTWARAQRSMLVVVAVASGQVPPVTAEEGASVVSQSVESWTLEEFKAACAHPQFFSAVRECLERKSPTTPEAEEPAALLDEKYWLVGGSARYMFSMSYDKAKGAIDEAFGKLVAITPTLLSGPGPYSTDMINRLFGFNSGKWYPASHYIITRIVQHGSIELLHTLAATAKHFKLPALDGYALQIEFAIRLRNHSSQSIVVYDERGNELQWAVGKLHYFSQLSELKNEELSAGDWLIPTLCNQGGYDVVQITTTTLRFIQLTRASTHSIKLNFMAAMQKHLCQEGPFELPNVEVVVVVSMCKKFTPGPIEGVLIMAQGQPIRWRLDDLKIVYLDRVTQAMEQVPAPNIPKPRPQLATKATGQSKPKRQRR